MRELRDARLGVYELAQALAAKEEAPLPVDELAVRLHHIHIPKLMEHGALTECSGGYQHGPEASSLLWRL